MDSVCDVAREQQVGLIAALQETAAAAAQEALFARSAGAVQRAAGDTAAIPKTPKPQSINTKAREKSGIEIRN